MQRQTAGTTMRWLLASSAIIAGASHAHAQAVTKAPPSAPAPQSIWQQDTLTGDWDGARTALHNKGIDITLNYINEAFGVLSGGINRQASYEGRFEFSVDTDLEKFAGWAGASTHVTIYQIHNSGHDAVDNVGSIADPSNIDALPTTRLFTAWFQQNALDDRVSLRIGQLAADDEFITSPTAGGLINGTFGWAGILAADMTSGGPAYPLATPGVRLALKPADQITIQTAVLSGDPAGSGCTDLPQACDRYGTTFSLSGGALWIGELQYAVNQGKGAVGLPGIYKLGGWYESADFADEHFGVDAFANVVSLAAPTAIAPLNHSGNSGIYGVADQMVWRADKQSLNLFLRAGASPADPNLISYYVDGGAGFKGLIAGRDDDTLTFGVAYAKISPDAAALDQDVLALNGPPYPIRDEEIVLELSYQAQLAPWWTLQPDLQYFVHPGGKLPDPNNPTIAIANAFVAGLRSTVKF